MTNSWHSSFIEYQCTDNLNFATNKIRKYRVHNMHYFGFEYTIMPKRTKQKMYNSLPNKAIPFSPLLHIYIYCLQYNSLRVRKLYSIQTENGSLLQGLQSPFLLPPTLNIGGDGGSFPPPTFGKNIWEGKVRFHG